MGIVRPDLVPAYLRAKPPARKVWPVPFVPEVEEHVQTKKAPCFPEERSSMMFGKLVERAIEEQGDHGVLASRNDAAVGCDSGVWERS